MSVNCVRCGLRKRDGLDSLCGVCRSKPSGEAPVDLLALLAIFQEGVKDIGKGWLELRWEERFGSLPILLFRILTDNQFTWAMSAQIVALSYMDFNGHKQQVERAIKCCRDRYVEWQVKQEQVKHG